MAVFFIWWRKSPLRCDPQTNTDTAVDTISYGIFVL